VGPTPVLLERHDDAFVEVVDTHCLPPDRTGRRHPHAGDGPALGDATSIQRPPAAAHRAAGGPCHVDLARPGVPGFARRHIEAAPGAPGADHRRPREGTLATSVKRTYDSDVA